MARKLSLLALFLLAPTLALAAAEGSSCVPPPPESERFLPLTEQPHPWGVPTLRPDHPRLFLDAAHLQRLRRHWRDPAYASIVHEYAFDTTLDPLSQALRGVAEDDPAACRLAARTVAGDDWRPKMNLSSGPPGGTDMSLFGPPETVYGDAAALVFDWCYAALAPDLKARLVAKIEAANERRETALNRQFQWHEAHFSGFHAYLMGVLAIEGESGASHRLQKAQNALQNWTELGNELHGDGSYKTYTYQDLFLIAPAILWSLATGQDVVRRNQFILHHAEFLLRRLSPDGKDFVAGPGDQAADARGMNFRLQNPSALGPLMIADYLRDGFAQWLGQYLLEKQGFGERWDNPRWLDLIFHNDNLTPVPPANARIPPVRYMQAGGMVDFRSGWNIDGAGQSPDIDAWFYLGPATAHAETDAGHFTLWRGADDLITEGANYLSRPTKYHMLWSALSFARNTAVFSPAGTATPDLEGSQLPPATMVYSDAQLYGDVGAQRLVAGESGATRAAALLASAEAYPAANRLIWYPGAIGYLGAIDDVRDLGGVAIAGGDATAAYDPAHVESYRRGVVYVKPDIFIIRDRFALKDDGRVRVLFHHRERADIGAFKIVRGSAEAGILESGGDRITIARGASQAAIQVLWPPSPTLRLVGGPGYEQEIDGAEIDARTGAADWLLKQPDFPERLARITGIWRIEIETASAAAQGEIVLVIGVGPRGATPPSARLLRDKTGETVELRRRDGTMLDVALVDAPNPGRGIAACLVH
jgi:hypothetical protein